MAFPNPDQLPPSSVYNNGNDVATVKPNPPSQMSVKLLPDNITYRVQISTMAYSLQNSRGVSLSQKIRVYFTPVTSVNPNSLQNATDISRAFSKAYILDEFTSPGRGGFSYRSYNAQTLGDGLFWATIVNPAAYGRMESLPAGPAFIDTGAEARLISSVTPQLVVGVSGGISSIFTPPNQTLKYAELNISYIQPVPLGSFDGVIPFIEGYFSNYGVTTPQFVEMGFYKFTEIVANVSMTLLCDYDSSAAPPLNIAHPVKIYLVATSKGRTLDLPVTSNLYVVALNGIGT